MKSKSLLSVLVMISATVAHADPQAPAAVAVVNAPMGVAAPKQQAPKVKPRVAPAQDMIKCDEPTMVSTGSDSPNYQYFQTLLTRGTDAPLSDFLKLWYPDRGDGSDLESPFFACEQEPEGAFTGTEDQIVPPNCRPDVLYSWGTVQKSHLTRHLPDGDEWTGPITTYNEAVASGTIFASLSAVSTFGYGDTLMRFRIKPGTLFKFEAFGAQPGEVAVRGDYFHDFAISDSSVLESVSIGTPEIYDEIVRDLQRYISDKRVSVYVPTGGTGIGRLFSQAVDGKDQSEMHLKQNLIEIIREIKAGEGQVLYAKGSCRNRGRKFSTAYPNYIEPRALPAGQ